MLERLVTSLFEICVILTLLPTFWEQNDVMPL